MTGPSAQAERDAVQRTVDHWLGVGEVDSVRGPGWYEAACALCPWFTNGREPVVDDAAYDHVLLEHEDKWRPLIGTDG